jgi:hypothetical protein
MPTHTSLLEAIDPTRLARVAGGLRSGDGGCIQPAPRWPFPTRPPQTPFDPTKIALPSAV